MARTPSPGDGSPHRFCSLADKLRKVTMTLTGSGPHLTERDRGRSLARHRGSPAADPCGHCGGVCEETFSTHISHQLATATPRSPRDTAAVSFRTSADTSG